MGKENPTPSLMFSFEYCCNMELQGPEGNPACWNLIDGVFSQDYHYERCCIALENYEVPHGTIGTATMLRSPEAWRVALAQLEASVHLRELMEALSKQVVL